MMRILRERPESMNTKQRTLNMETMRRRPHSSSMRDRDKATSERVVHSIAMRVLKDATMYSNLRRKSTKNPITMITAWRKRRRGMRSREKWNSKKMRRMNRRKKKRVKTLRMWREKRLQSMMLKMLMMRKCLSNRQRMMTLK